MLVLGVDPGEKRIGLAISDPLGTLARPLLVIPHTNRQEDAARIAEFAVDHQVERIVVGQATDMDGKPNLSGRKAYRLAAAVRALVDIPVELWDESYSTRDAQRIWAKMGCRRDAGNQHLDDRAAAIILQSYLDAHSGEPADE